jgi:hypothetical protein
MDPVEVPGHSFLLKDSAKNQILDLLAVDKHAACGLCSLLGAGSKPTVCDYQTPLTMMNRLAGVNVLDGTVADTFEISFGLDRDTALGSRQYKVDTLIAYGSNALHLISQFAEDRAQEVLKIRATQQAPFGLQ